MCNDYEQHVLWKLYTETMQAAELGIPSRQSELDLTQADDIRIGDRGPVIQPMGNGVGLASLKFGFPPKGRGGPVFNMTSDYMKGGVRHLRDFSQSKRCVVIASAFFEFTGKTYPKAKHRFTLQKAPFLGIAGLYDDDAFTMLTTTPGPDIEPYHDRQVVVLHPSEFGRWLWFENGAHDLLAPMPSGSLAVETVRHEAIPAA